MRRSSPISKIDVSNTLESMSTTEIIEAALKLTPYERFVLVDSIVNSLDKPDEKLNEIWLDEAERRLKAYDEGRLGAVPMEQVFRRIK